MPTKQEMGVETFMVFLKFPSIEFMGFYFVQREEDIRKESMCVKITNLSAVLGFALHLNLNAQSLIFTSNIKKVITVS